MLITKSRRRLPAIAMFLLALAACTSPTGRPDSGAGTAGRDAGSGSAAAGGRQRLLTAAQPASSLPRADHVTAGGQQAGNEPDKVLGHVEHDTIGGHAEPLPVAVIFGEISSTGAPRLPGDLRQCPRVCPDTPYVTFDQLAAAGETSLMPAGQQRATVRRPSKLPGGQHRLAEASTPTLTHRNERRGRTPGQSEHILAESALEHCQVQASRSALISTVPVDTARAQPGNGVTGSADQKLLARCIVCRNYAMAD